MADEPCIDSVQTLEEQLSEPTPAALAALKACPGDVLLLGVGGKMGPTLARMVVRAAALTGTPRRVVGASRFSEAGLEERLHQQGVETIRCDLLDPAALAALPEMPNVIAMTGMKFGATGNESRTWAMNAWLAGAVAQRFALSRLVAFSTGNVYGLSPVALGGSVETDVLRPSGEYSMSCVGRERLYEHFSRHDGTPMAILRLNYACELRYGVLVDLAVKVWRGESVDLTMGHFNVLWQADANAAALSALPLTASPPLVVNLAGPELLSVRRVCLRFGELFGKEPQFTGVESGDAFLSNGQRGHALFGYPRVGVEQMLRWVGEWVRRDNPLLGRPTHFENRRGDF